MAGSIRKKEKVTEYYDDDFDDFEISEIDISEILGPKENDQVNVMSKNAKKPEKETPKNEEPKATVDELIQDKGGLINFEIDDEETKINEKSKKEKKKKEEENIIEFVPKDIMGIEKDLEEEKEELEEEPEEEYKEEQEEKPKRGRRKKEETAVEEAKENRSKTLKSKRRRLYNLNENDKEVKMEIDEEDNAMVLTLKKKNCRVDIMPEEFNIYVNNAKSYIIARQERLYLIFKDTFLNIEKNEKSYTIETDQDVKLDYIACDIIKSENKLIFTVENLSEVKIDEKGLKLIIDETKVAENKVEDNNTLVISEEEGKVFLPYKKGEILQEIKRTKNTNIDEIIQNNYVKPIENYKNSIRARFKEGYKLMHEREGESRNKAFMLGLELMFEFHLHPAIISACRNLEELDIYLDCLEDNELEKFSCFKIIYKAMPVIRKRAKAHMI